MDQAKQPNLRYLVLATGTLKQELLASVLSRRFPKERGRIFLPEREYWIRKTQSVGRKPLFPGYLFAHTDMSQKELYLFVRQNSRDIMTYVSELSVRTIKSSGLTIDDRSWSELTADETSFLDRILDAEGVERMSAGYKQGEHYNIVEGPLKGLEEHIVRSNRHDREAYLDVTFREKPVVVGLDLRPKKAFFPDGEEINNTMLLDDGTEVDLKELATRMMGGG
ncbi:MAG: hypothetical protein J6O73_11485 [Lachnospiraceae bacterium]|nr:hypothetical protein [Lachnospiraceae bacterium]